MNNNSKMMSWQDKHGSVIKVMEVLDQVNAKGGDKERELLDILLLTAKLLLPAHNVKLLIEPF